MLVGGDLLRENRHLRCHQARILRLFEPAGELEVQASHIVGHLQDVLEPVVLGAKRRKSRFQTAQGSRSSWFGPYLGVLLEEHADEGLVGIVEVGEEDHVLVGVLQM